MKWAQKEKGKLYVVRIDAGEELKASLKRFCAESGIKSAAIISGIGAAKRATLIVPNEDAKPKEREFDKMMELIAISGNITEGGKTVHIHCVCIDGDYTAAGGHLVSAVINPTCEIFLIETDQIERRENKESGINELDL